MNIDPLKPILRPLLALPYLGRRYQCPICGWHFRLMLTAGTVPRANAQCPRCKSLERHRLIWLYLQQRSDLFTRPQRLLHIAPERVFTTIFEKQANIETISVDIKSPLAAVHADLTNLPLPGSSVDAILCIHVLEHILDDRKAMAELFRVLKPGGWAILQTPLDVDQAATYEDAAITGPQERLRHFGQSDHVRIYGRDYKDRLQTAGFSVRLDPLARTLSPEQQKRYRIFEWEDIWTCSKPAP